MTTSDSEDFESADEEIEPDPSVYLPKSKIKSSHQHEVIPDDKNVPDHTERASKSHIPGASRSNKTKTVELAPIERGVFDLVLEEKDQNEIGNVNSTKLSESIPEAIQEKKKETVHGSDDTHEKDAEDRGATSSHIEETNIKVPLDDNQSSTRSQRNRKPQRSKENKAGPMKLGVRVTPAYDIKVENQKVDNTGEGSSNSTEVIEKSSTEGQVPPCPPERISEASSMKIEPENSTNKVEQQPAEQSSGWGFGKNLIGASTWSSMGGWGSSLFNTASLSVSTLGSHVTQGISTVLETVEAGIGAPSPEELAIKLKEEEEMKKIQGNDGKPANEGKEDAKEEELEMDEGWGDWKDDDDQGESGKSGTGLFSLVSGVTQVTGKVLSTGLGTLETIGKKTMEVLQEGDPGLKKKRALLLGDETVILSQVLREAKEKAEAEALLAEEKEAMRKAHFETLFDDFQGLVHLEALEMLSRQSDLRLKSLLLKETGPALRALQIRLAAVQEMCEIPEHDEEDESSINLTENLPESLKSLKIDISAEKVIKSCKDSFGKLEDMKKESESKESKITTRVIHQEAISALAFLTANSIELFHKVTELLLVKEGKCREVKDEAKTLAEITSLLTSEVNKIAAAYSDFLSTKLNNNSLSAEDKEKIESSITSIFLEASNSSTYIQDAFQLMVPILQCGAVA